MTKNRSPAPAALVTLAGLVALAGCAQRPASLDTAQTAIQSARTDPDVNTYAAAELDAAQTQLQSANQAWEGGEGSRRGRRTAPLLATQQVEIARAPVPKRARAQAQIADLGDQRDKVMRQAAEQQVTTLQQQLASMQARQTDRGIVLTVGDVLFDTGQATLKPGAVNEIVRLATFLRDNPDRAVRIEGHTDSTGSMHDQHGPVAAPGRRGRRHAGGRRHPAHADRGHRLRPGLRRWRATPRRPAGSRTAGSRW